MEPPKRLPVDWDQLETALTWHGGEWRCYLDLRTGDIVPSALLFGEEFDEEAQLSAEGDAFPEAGGPIPERQAEAGVDEGRPVPIEPLPSSVEYGWMEEFAGTVTEPRLKGRLEAALAGRGAFRRFEDSLFDYPEEQTRWFAFRDERMREVIREWLAAHHIEPTMEPRERRG